MRAIKPKGLIPSGNSNQVNPSGNSNQVNYNTVCITLSCMLICIFLFFGSYGLFILINHHRANNTIIHPIRSDFYNIPIKKNNHESHPFTRTSTKIESICDYNGIDVCLLSIYGFFGGFVGCGVIIYIIFERIRLYISERNGTSYYDLM
jgi:hypothetical protein